MNKTILERVVLTLLCILWMVVIFMYSNQPAVESTGSSQSFIKETIIKVYKLFDRNVSDEKVEGIVETLDVPIRKLGHFTEYFILGILVFLAMKSFNINKYYIAIFLCFLYSCSDEFHQLFVTGRSGEFKDVILDTFGSTCGILLIKKCVKFNFK